MYKTFNCGIGMVLIVRDSKANLTIKNLKKIGFSSSVIGHVQKSNFKKVFYENNLWNLIFYSLIEDQMLFH